METVSPLHPACHPLFCHRLKSDQTQDITRVLFLATSIPQASSSLDPSFWASHPTMERLFMYSLLTGNVQDMHWADSNMVMATKDDEVYEELISAYGETCMGHRGFDVFPFGLLENDTNGFKVGYTGRTQSCVQLGSVRS